MDKSRIGLPAENLPLTKAKRHLASVWAGRAVVAAETFGPDYVESVSLRVVGTALGRLLYRPGSQWASTRVEQGDFALAVQLMVPLYAARATEEVLFGRERATLSTAPEIAMAGQLARWLLVQSRINPALWSVPVPIHEDSPITQFVDRLQVWALLAVCLHFAVVFRCRLVFSIDDCRTAQLRAHGTCLVRELRMQHVMYLDYGKGACEAQ